MDLGGVYLILYRRLHRVASVVGIWHMQSVMFRSPFMNGTSISQCGAPTSISMRDRDPSVVCSFMINGRRSLLGMTLHCPFCFPLALNVKLN